MTHTRDIILGRHSQGAKHIFICSPARGRGRRDLHGPECKKRSRRRRREVRRAILLELFWQNRVKILRSLFGNIYNKMSQIMPSSRDQSKRSITKQMSPAIASQLEGLWKESQSYTNGFQEPEMQQITKVDLLESCLRFIFLFIPGECTAIQEGRSKLWLQLSAAQQPLGAPVREAPGLADMMRRAIEKMPSC